MSDIIPRIPIEVRPATADDLPFIDALQKRNSRAVGFMKRVWLEEKLAEGQVLLAEQNDTVTRGQGDKARNADALPLSPPHLVPLSPCLPTHLGYIIFVDRYMKHDDVGIVWQLNVVSEFRRSLVGAALVQAAFERAAYGCKLCCLWCAQDLEANRFWESLGFVPLAFRTGSERKRRVHIFWQKRVRDGDESTSYWFPFQTGAGAIGENRIVLPIPPGVHWSDEMPVVLPNDECGMMNDELKKLPGPKTPHSSLGNQHSATIRTGALHFGLPKPAKAKRPREPRRKNDPKHVAAARELRDRYVEQLNAGVIALPAAASKYAVTRTLPVTHAPPLLEQRAA